ncbi:peptidoglycan DD-metalloendopeptidase family protein [Candidatus Giovannonibacteria bacterium]|nr:peptidoglycan DD-metalloendopeptidase family protein [Candidatus Giovannonibacteria bacterium]
MALAIFFSYSTPAEADFFSFVSRLVHGEEVVEEEVFNVQKLPLLKAPNTAEPVLAVGGTVMNFVEGSSILPVIGPLGSVADVETYKLDQITTYTIRDGDNISKIADMFGVSLQTIYWANDLKRTDVIRPGDTLVILPISGLQYEVKKGDTVASIAKKYKSDAEEITAFNDLTPGAALKIGATLIIPDAELNISASPSLSSSSTKAKARGAGGPNLVGYFLRPIDGGRKSQGLHGFNGVDLANSCGTPVIASASGDVLLAKSVGWNGGYGQYIVIRHPNGVQTLYSHLSAVYVTPGQFIAQGGRIGNVGTSGNSTGCHLHFEVRGAVNPF